MKRILSVIFGALLLASVSLSAAKPVKIQLWPDGAPTKNGLEGIEEKWNGKRLSDVSVPELWIYPAKNPNGQAVIAAPGGGYTLLSTDNEGTMFVDWMNAQGITLAVLMYRMPNGHSEVPLEDGRRAIEIMREKAAEYGFNPDEVGIMGSSAGGHFAATLSTMYGDKKYRPDFQILLYPVITMTDLTHNGSRNNLLGKDASAADIEKYSLENRVDANTPPAFIILATDDKTVNPLNSLHYAEALQQNGVPYSMHIYPTGGHGFGFRDSYIYKPQWSAELERWLRSQKK
ncbi:MAG: alpha/beta hydrolase [Bacteroides sp.]|nr:alpha/beta hydrolase [Bacteroides sp.]